MTYFVQQSPDDLSRFDIFLQAHSGNTIPVAHSYNEDIANGIAVAFNRSQFMVGEQAQHALAARATPTRDHRTDEHTCYRWHLERDQALGQHRIRIERLQARIAELEKNCRDLIAASVQNREHGDDAKRRIEALEARLAKIEGPRQHADA